MGSRRPAEQDLLIRPWSLGWIMERTGEEPDFLLLFQNSLQAAVREVRVDVRGFKQQMEEKVEQLQEQNLQLRARLEALSCLVEALTGAKVDQGAPEGNRTALMNGSMESQEVVAAQSSSSTLPEAPETGGGSSGPSSVPAPPPWRTRRHAEATVSIPLDWDSSSWKLQQLELKGSPDRLHSHQRSCL